MEDINIEYVEKENVEDIAFKLLEVAQMLIRR